MLREEQRARELLKVSAARHPAAAAAARVCPETRVTPTPPRMETFTQSLRSVNAT